ncbi:hypothetical protein BC835DRAFT_1306267 [Cytidiella melzeri]|nr:hypothetical protein BC835DRAFT_1306267 [Cytidiella melzeri]
MSGPGIVVPGSILSIIHSTPIAGSTPTASVEPSTAASTSSSHSHAGAIAGGVIGGIALLLALIGVFVYYRYRRRSAPYHARRGRGPVAAADVPKSADVFTGVDTLVGDDASKTGPKRSVSYGSKVGRYDSSSSIGHGRPSMSYEDSQAQTPTTLQGHRSMDSIEKPSEMPLDYMPALPANANSIRGRSKSVIDQSRAAALAALDGNGTPTSRSQYPPVPARRSEDARTSCPESMMQLGRSESMTRGSRVSRRATRKAVPKYDGAELSNPTSPTYSTNTPDSANSADDSSAILHVTPSMSREDLVASGFGIPELNHKSSFGNKAMHYLIPDPPPRPVE